MFSYKSFILLFLILFTHYNSNGQLAGKAKLDSLLSEVNLNIKDTNQVNLYNQITYLGARISPDVAIKYGEMALELSKELKFIKGQAVSKLGLCNYFLYQSKFDKAIAYAKESIKSYEKLENNYNSKSGIAGVNVSLGVIYRRQNQFEKATIHLNKALKLNLEIKNEKALARIYNQMGNQYAQEQNYKKALDVFKKALEINKRLSNNIGIAQNLGNIGLIHEIRSNMVEALKVTLESLEIKNQIGDSSEIAVSHANLGVIYSKMSNYKKSLYHYKISLNLNLQAGLKDVIATNYNMLGSAYENMSNFDKALEYYFKSLNLNQEINNEWGISSNYNNIANIYSQYLNDEINAEKNYLKALSILENSSNKVGISLILNNIGNYYLKVGNSDKALDYYQESLDKKIEIGDRIGIADQYLNLGSLYQNTYDYNKALEYFLKGYELYNELNIKEGLARSIGDLGIYYFLISQDSTLEKMSEKGKDNSFKKQNSLKKSVGYLEQSVELYRSIHKADKEIFQLGILSKSYDGIGQFEKAYKALSRSNVLKDSIFSIEKTKQLTQMLFEREQFEKERSKRDLEQKLAEELNRRYSIQYRALASIVVFMFMLILLSGKIKIKSWLVKALVFISLILLFEFVLVLIDPLSDKYSGGEPIIKFLINFSLALIIFPIHQLFEKLVAKRVLKENK